MAISVRSQIEYTKLPSKRFLCWKCLHYAIEWTPVIKRAMVGGMRRLIEEDLNGVMPKVWLQCPNGCARYHGFRDISDRSMRRRVMWDLRAARREVTGDLRAALLERQAQARAHRR